MNLQNLNEVIEPMVGEKGGGSLVAGIDIETGETFSIRGVQAEHNADGDGSTTIWLRLDKN